MHLEIADEFQKKAMYIEQQESTEKGYPSKEFDDDGREKRTGTLLTASSHIITAVIGSGVLSLSWAFAQLGWVAGPPVLLAFAVITYYTSTLVADCYRSPGPVSGKRNCTYMEVVRAHLGGYKVQLCAIAQYVNLVGITVGYTITASISMVAIMRSNCFHKYGHHDKCFVSNYPFMVLYAAMQIVLSQIPDFHKLSWLSILAAVMSFAYSLIGIGLSIAKTAADGKHVKTSLTGVEVGVDVTAAQKFWRTFQALGDIAFSYAYTTVLIEIQDTLKSPPPENGVMKKASLVSVCTTTVFYILCGCMGYAAFGNNAPGNFLTGFGFYEPFWLIDFANACIAVHLIGAYQVFCQPIYAFVEGHCSRRWPDNKFINAENGNLHLFKLVWRTVYVILTAVIAMIFPFFNDFLGLLGALAFYPLTVYFPIQMHIAQVKVARYSSKWVWLQILNWVCLIVSLLAAVGSIEGLFQDVRTYQPFKTQE